MARCSPHAWRVVMLASAGFLVQESFHPLFTADGGPAIEQIPKLRPWMWFIMTLEWHRGGGEPPDGHLDGGVVRAARGVLAVA